MARFTVLRIFQALLAVVVVTLIVFLLLNVSGDPVTLMLPENASQEMIDEYRHKLGLDRSLPEQYVHFLLNAARGDFGTSFRQKEPAMQVILRHLPATAQLAGCALIIGTLVSIPLGILAAIKRGTIIDTIAVIISTFGQSMPVFWFGLLVILLFAVRLNWLPVGGRGDWKNLVLPACTLGWYMSAAMTRLVRSAMLEVLSEHYIRTARGKGLKESVVITRHALRNALIPLLTVWGLQAGSLLTSAVVTETTFSWPGVGRASIYAVSGRDYPVVLASVFLFSLMFVSISTLVDLSYAWIDPRIRIE
ncbi:MAG: ABC transporter permease [Anaerolineales bacterium]|nr:ABC transporter permease [Anaerolineales bacterium]